jgi:hypothetical protein
LVGWLGGLSLVHSHYFALGYFFYVTVWCVQGTPPPLEVGTSSLVLNAFDVGFLIFCLPKRTRKRNFKLDLSLNPPHWQHLAEEKDLQSVISRVELLNEAAAQISNYITP